MGLLQQRLGQVMGCRVRGWGGHLGLSFCGQEGEWASIRGHHLKNKATKYSASELLVVSPSWMLLLFICCIRFFVTPWTVAHQASLSMGFPRQEYWSGLPSPFPGDHPEPGIEPESPAWQADSLTAELPGKPPFTIRKCQSEEKP